MTMFEFLATTVGFLSFLAVAIYYATTKEVNKRHALQDEEWNKEDRIYG